ncbi:MAG TPA: ABC transporter permease [Thermodesulfobacteriota bacterium]|nr:ABC transporter permease [Thermodesulfobacteriota bacterium]
MAGRVETGGAGGEALDAAGRLPASRLARLYLRHERALVGAGALVAVLLLWEGLSRGGLVSPVFISAPSRVALAAYRLAASGELWRHLRISGFELLSGYLLAAAVGVPLGLAIGWYRRLHWCLAPFVYAFNAVPRVAFLPVLIIWFGIGIWSKVAVVFLGAVVPIVLHTLAGVRTTDARLLRVARSFGASDFKLFRSVVLPGTVPFVFTGLKYASGRALLSVVVGELYAATSGGIGHLIATAGQTLQTDKVFVGVLVVTLTGVALVELLDRLERRFDAWRPQVGSSG